MKFIIAFALIACTLVAASPVQQPIRLNPVEIVEIVAPSQPLNRKARQFFGGGFDVNQQSGYSDYERIGGPFGGLTEYNSGYSDYNAQQFGGFPGGFGGFGFGR